MSDDYTEDVQELSAEEIHEALAERHEGIWKHRQWVQRLQYERAVLHTELRRREGTEQTKQ